MLQPIPAAPAGGFAPTQNGCSRALALPAVRHVLLGARTAPARAPAPQQAAAPPPVVEKEPLVDKFEDDDEPSTLVLLVS